MRDPLRIFLDANIIFSASHKEDHRFLQFWKMRDLIPMTSMYVVDETQRYCVSTSQSARLTRLLQQTHFVSDIPGAFLPRGIVLPATGAPILAAAVFAGADYLITGDKYHFGKWMLAPIETHLGQLIIQEPSRFLIDHKDRLR
jgi:predicted nucleic acid-binding protein